MNAASEPRLLPPLPLFETGQVVATPGALQALEQAGVSPKVLIARHVFGDDGDLCDEDRRTNRQAIALGGRVFSSYAIGTGLSAVKVWVITEAVDDHGRRVSTCLLLPEEY